MIVRNFVALGALVAVSLAEPAVAGDAKHGSNQQSATTESSETAKERRSSIDHQDLTVTKQLDAD